MHEMYSFLIKEMNNVYKKEVILENYKKILIVIMPIIPHFSNECLERINSTKNISWPKYDEDLLEEKEKLIVIQINGKKRGLLTAAKDISENDLLKMVKNDEKLIKYVQKNEIKKKIYVKNKLLNIIL